MTTKLFYLSPFLLDREEKIRRKSNLQVEIMLFTTVEAKVWVQTQKQVGLLSSSHQHTMFSFFLGSRATAHIDIALECLRFSVKVWNCLSDSCKAGPPVYLHSSRTCHCGAPLRDLSKVLCFFSTVLHTH